MTNRTTWHVEDIKAELRKRYGSLTALDRLWGYRSGVISTALGTPGMSRRVEKRIAAELERPLHVLWPDRWHPDGTPVSFRADRTPTKGPADALRAKGAAA